MKSLYIVGAGGFGREVLWLVKRINEASFFEGKGRGWKIEGFIDGNTELHETMQDEYPVLGGCDYFNNILEEIYIIVAIGSAKVKRKVVNKLSRYKNIKFATLIDPTAIVSDRVKIGAGCIICAGTIVTVDIILGRNVIINLDCTLGHDVMVGDYTTVYPSTNISGNVKIDEEVELGTGVQIIQGKNIGSQSIIGAGAVVVKDIPKRCTAVGSPAKPIRFF